MNNNIIEEGPICALRPLGFPFESLSFDNATTSQQQSNQQ